MKLSTKVTWLAAAVIAAALIVGTLWLSERGARQAISSRLTVGFVIATTGYGAAFGAAESNAVVLLRERYPEHKFVIEDSRSDPKSGLSAVRKLIDVDKVDVVYCDLTTVANAIAPITDRDGKVLMAAVYLRDLIERTRLSLRNLPTAAEEAELAIAQARRSGAELSRVIALGSNDEFGLGSMEDFEAALKTTGGALVRRDFLPDAEDQVATFAARIAAEKPGAVYAASLQPNLGLFIKALREAGYIGPILTTDAFTYNYIRSAAGRAGKGTIYVDFAGGQDTADFAARYRARFGQDFTPVAGILYDGISLLLNNAKTHPLTPPQSFVDSLEGQMWAGVLGQITVKRRELRYPLVAKVAE